MQGLKAAIDEIAKRKTAKDHQQKIVEECGELITALIKNGDRAPNDDTLGEIGDVLNTIEIYLRHHGIDVRSLDEYRTQQIEKHLRKVKST